MKSESHHCSPGLGVVVTVHKYSPTNGVEQDQAASTGALLFASTSIR